MTSTAQLTKGVCFFLEDSNTPGTFLEVENVTNVAVPTGSANVIDKSNLKSVAVEKLMGLPDSGQCTVSLDNDETAPNQLLLFGLWQSGARHQFRVQVPAVPPGTEKYNYDFYGYVLQDQKTFPVNEKQQVQIAVEIDGPVTRTVEP